MELEEEDAILPPALGPGVAPPKRIEVEGLVLRGWTPDDLQARFDAMSASYEHLHAWMDWMREPPTLEGQRAWDEFRGFGWPDETGFNYGIFDAAHGFRGCIPGLHEVLRRQGLFEGVWCLDPAETLSPGQSEEIDRVCRHYPHLTDDDFVAAGRDGWLRS